MKSKNRIIPILTAAPLSTVSALFLYAGTDRPNDISSWIKNGALIVDVRTPAEFENAHFPGAINIPLQDIEKRINEFGPRDGRIIVYCRTGNRSGKAKTFLESRGYKNVLNGGGLQDMLKASGR